MFKEAFEKAEAAKAAKAALVAARARKALASRNASRAVAREGASFALALTGRSPGILLAARKAVEEHRSAVSAVSAVSDSVPAASGAEALKAFSAAMERWEKLATKASEALEESGGVWGDATKVASTRAKLLDYVRGFSRDFLPNSLRTANASAAEVVALMEGFRMFPGMGAAIFGSAWQADRGVKEPAVYSRHVRLQTEESLEIRGVRFVRNPNRATIRLGNRKIFRPSPEAGFIQTALLLGAEATGDSAVSWEQQILERDDAGEWTVNWEKTFSQTVIVGLDGAHTLTAEQSAVLGALVIAQAVNKVAFAGDTARKKAFGSALDSLSKMTQAPSEGFVDAEYALWLRESFKCVGIAFPGELAILDDRIGQISPVLLDREVKCLYPDYRVRVTTGRYGPSGHHDGVGTHVGSTDKAKGTKRTDAYRVLQAQPVHPSLSSVTYRGVRGTGTVVTCLLVPSGDPSIFGGSSGGVIQLDPEFGKNMPTWDKHTFVGTSFAIKSEEERRQFQESFPKVGEMLGETLEVFGAPSIRVPRELKGAEIVKAVLVSDSNQYRNLRWRITVRFVNNSGSHKIRGPLKAMVTKALVAKLRGQGLKHSDVLGSPLVIAGYDGESLLASMDAFKGTGKGNARFRVDVAVETFRYYLPEVEADALLKELLPRKAFAKDGTVVYREDLDSEGVYELLMTEFEKRFSKPISGTRTMSKDLWDAKLQDALAMANTQSPDWVPFTEGNVSGKSATIVVGEGITGKPESYVFTAYDNGRYAVTRHSTGFKTAMLLKAEHAGPRTVCKTVSMMLEVAYALQAMGMPHAAAHVAEGGRQRARGVLNVHHLVQGKVLPGRKVLNLGDLSVEEKQELQHQLEGDLLEWPLDMQVYIKAGGRKITIAREVLELLPLGGPQWSAVRGLIEAAMRGDIVRVENNIRVLHTGLLGMIAPSNKQFYKKLHEGSKALYAKRTPIFGDHAGVHEEYRIHPFGGPARILASHFGCKVEELEGRHVLVSRDPMLLPILLRIVFDTSIGMFTVGVSDLVMSSENGDADGDCVKAMAVTCEKALEELKRYSAIEMAKAIHAYTHEQDPFHWVEQNRFIPGKHNRWARASYISDKEMIELDAGTIRSYREQMPKDANRAHMALSVASMDIPDEFREFSIAEANGLMFSVYEAQLGGYSPTFDAVHQVFSSNKPPSEKMDEVIAAARHLDLRENFAKAWLRVVWAKGQADNQAREGAYIKDPEGNEVYLVQAKVPANASQARSFAPVIRIMAVAMKLLAQGAIAHPLMTNLDKTMIQIRSQDKVVGTYSLMSLIGKQADAKVPGALRLRYWATQVLPVVRESVKLVANSSERYLNDE